MALAPRAAIAPNDLQSFWMPFTANRAFKKAPRLIARAKDMHYFTTDGRKLIDGTAGLWGGKGPHPRSCGLGTRIAALAPADLDHVFFCNSGSEAVDTALKIALAYHAIRGEGHRPRLIGRGGGYHG